jgi:hypothetical protein
MLLVPLLILFTVIILFFPREKSLRIFLHQGEFFFAIGVFFYAGIIIIIIIIIITIIIIIVIIIMFIIYVN